MVSDEVKRLVEGFNTFFKGRAELRVNGDRLEITIDSQTLLIALPTIIGGQAKGSS